MCTIRVRSCQTQSIILRAVNPDFNTICAASIILDQDLFRTLLLYVSHLSSSVINLCKNISLCFSSDLQIRIHSIKLFTVNLSGSFKISSLFLPSASWKWIKPAILFNMQLSSEFFGELHCLLTIN